ncbi:helix-turn-helix domain-containing protein [Micromonospora rubida]|uniref:helix-turn-helix domain-containing protein n=1 Tax=Micromonospora rubida TaxID=2697657 RepID=UPI00137671A9|nr:helix-turn-helix domain-containing protein [Micromonospora rubida]NBE84579.1 HTH domain-containing protein [Micromonospora rubida]
MSRMTAGQRHEQELTALELSNAGHSIDTIAERLDISRRTAARRVQAALERIPAQEADTLRRQSEARFNGWMRRANVLLDSPELSIQDTVKVVGLLLSLERERVQLYGLRLPAAFVVQHELGPGGPGTPDLTGPAWTPGTQR